VSTEAIVARDAIVDYQTDPSRYRHWRVAYDGAVATLTLDVNEDGGLRPGYKLKLNSYDLGVDIELHDAVQRIRFEHPEIRVVIITSGKTRIFSSGANIYMLGLSSHSWKVNFCKFTNETRNGLEDSSRHSGLKFIAACNGTTAGGGYELALACDEIILVDDRSSAVSLPEVPLLGVLPGTGGLTRLTDKRKVRRDLADMFCTTADGVRGQRAKEWGLVDAVVKTHEFAGYVKDRAASLAQRNSTGSQPVAGISLTPLQRDLDADAVRYDYVQLQLNRGARVATINVKAPTSAVVNMTDALAAGAGWWPLQMARELEDAILHLRTNELECGLWLLKTSGSADAVLAIDEFLLQNQDHWFPREVLGLLRRTFARLDASSRSMFAIVESESCFAGTLFELALAADRTYMLDQSSSDKPSVIRLSGMNLGPLTGLNDTSRLAARFYGDSEAVNRLQKLLGSTLGAADALSHGLVTAAPDSLDWDDEIRQAIELRTALSPDALTGLEANLRFGLPETQSTRVFGRLSPWQNWIFIRPNAVGPDGALKVYGKGKPSKFDWERV
jgi:benzoyl-CoA-dihydrodiol lyase